MYHYNGTSAPSYRMLMNLYRAKFFESVAAGEIKPLVVPYHAFGLFLLISYLCIRHVSRPWVYTARWPVLAAIVVFEVKKILETTSISAGIGFGVGLTSAWCIVWSLTLLVWTRPQYDAKRVKTRKIGIKAKDEDRPAKKEKPSNTVEGLKVRLQQNGRTKASSTQTASNGKHRGTPSAEVATEYFWQSYPEDSFRARLVWVLDLVCNFRLPGWNWEISTSPGLPAKVKAGLGESIDLRTMKLKSSVGTRQFISRTQLLITQLPRFVIGYLLLDAIKVLMIKDPYFLIGPNDYPLPLHLVSLSPFTLLIYRQLLVLFAIIIALKIIFFANAFLLCIVLGPPILGERGEAWMYPTIWGSIENIHTKGLAGFWGGWWHQTFRFAFLAPSNYLIRRCLLSPRTPTTKIVTLFIASTISAFLHACGSITQFPHTVPRNQFLFFLLQPLGILLQMGFCIFFKSHIREFTSQFRRAGNFSYTFTWLFVTSPLLIDDFARGGIWLFEPLPISPLRGLGFGGDADQRWLVWDFFGMWYVGGHRWWECGWLI